MYNFVFPLTGVCFILLALLPCVTDGQSAEHLGCFVDSNDDRVLPGISNCLSLERKGFERGFCRIDDLTIEKCFDLCRSARDEDGEDYVYAGVEFGQECFCGISGIDYSRHGEAPENDCADPDYTCTGNSTQYCGGLNRISIFNIFTEEVSTSNPTSIGTIITVSSVTTATTTNVAGVVTALGILVGMLVVYGIVFTTLYINLRHTHTKAVSAELKPAATATDDPGRLRQTYANQTVVEPRGRGARLKSNKHEDDTVAYEIPYF